MDKHYPLPDCPDLSGLAPDPADHRAFISCLKGLLVVLDTTSGRAVASLPIGPGGQSVIYDAQRKRVFSANANYTLSVVAIDDPNTYHLLATV